MAEFGPVLPEGLSLSSESKESTSSPPVIGPQMPGDAAIGPSLPSSSDQKTISIGPEIPANIRLEAAVEEVVGGIGPSLPPGVRLGTAEDAAEEEEEEVVGGIGPALPPGVHLPEVGDDQVRFAIFLEFLGSL